MEKLLFLDIETHKVKNWDELPPNMKKAFESHLWDSDVYDDIEECYDEKAGLHPEFSHVICISLGYEWDGGFRLMSLYGVDEVNLLTELAKILTKFSKSNYSLAGHNINGFDKPYLCKRYVINRMKIPPMINSMGVKPWELSDVDTMQLWKFGGWNNISLEVICAALGIKCKSTEISGSNMYRVDIKDMDWNDLKAYCEEDVKSSYDIYKTVTEFL